MKKLYTILAAAAVALSASAAPVTVKADASLSTAPKTIKSLSEIKDTKVSISDLNDFTARRNAKAKAPAEFGTGTYQIDGIYLNSGNLVPETLTLDSYFTLDGDKMTIEGFISPDLVVEGTYDATKKTVTIPCGTLSPILDDKGQPTGDYVAFAAVKPTDGTILPSITLQYFEEERAFQWFADYEVDEATQKVSFLSALAIFTQKGEADAEIDQSYGLILGLDINGVNGVMQVTIELENQDGTPAFDDKGNRLTRTLGQMIYVYTGENEEKKACVYTENMFGPLIFNSGIFGEPVEFVLNDDKTKATVTDGIVANASYAVTQPNVVYYLWGLNDKGAFDDTYVEFDVVTRQIQTGEIYTFLTTPKAGVGLLSGDGLNFINFIIQLPFDITNGEGAGIEDVTVDANAPVEFFNLQGMRVANPESGLYIRRQGGKATKVLVK